MNKKTYLSIFGVGLFIVFLLGFSKVGVSRMKGFGAGLFGSVWNGTLYLKPQTSEEVESLRLQNYLLNQELSKLKELYQSQLEFIADIESTALKPADAERYVDEKRRLLKWQMDAVPARVVYRSPSQWNSTLWVNVGEATNRELGRTIIAKDSPVTIGTAVVGVVELVNERRSLVRLISDDSLRPSVRVKRGEQYLAKGELHGGGLPLWRSQNSKLKGVGFNYDFSDEKGPAMDLRSQNPPIIRVDDLLVTTGMDGVFPEGLDAARITKIEVLKEGDFFYEIEAEPAAGNLDHLSLVFILPPVSA